MAGVAICFGVVEPTCSSKHTVTLHLVGPIDEVTRIDTVWNRVGRDGDDGKGDDAAAGVSLFFAQGKAPRYVTTTVQVPSGLFELDVVVSRGSKRTTTRQQLNLDGNAKVFVAVEEQ